MLKYPCFFVHTLLKPISWVSYTLLLHLPTTLHLSYSFSVTLNVFSVTLNVFSVTLYVFPVCFAGINNSNKYCILRLFSICWLHNLQHLKYFILFSHEMFVIHFLIIFILMISFRSLFRFLLVFPWFITKKKSSCYLAIHIIVHV